MRLGVESEIGENIIAFAREHEGTWALTIAPRLTTALAAKAGTVRESFPGWRISGDARLVLPKIAPSSWWNAITDKSVRAKSIIPLFEALEHFPVALLLGREAE